jgi:hypothetical protein
VSRRRDWTDANEHDPGIAILELLDYLSDLLADYQDKVAAESRRRNRRLVAVALAAAALAVWRCR